MKQPSVLFVTCVVLVIVLSTATGCVASLERFRAGTSQDDESGHRPLSEGGLYTGPECARWHIQGPRSEGVYRSRDPKTGQESFSGVRRPGLNRVEAATFVVCVDAISAATAWKAIVADHRDFDDRHFDHLRAATMVIDCAMEADCSQSEETLLGMLATYARRVDPSAADAAFAAAGASPALRQAFGAKLVWARRQVEARLKGWDPRLERLWVGVPESVWTERRKHFTRHARLFAELDSVLSAADAGAGDLGAIAAKLRALRGRYLESCKVQGCLFSPFVLETTRALALLAVRQKDVTQAVAEARLFADERLQEQFFSRAMLSAVVTAAKREDAAYEKYAAAQQKGADQSTLRAMFGDAEPINIASDRPLIVWGYKSMPDVTAELPREGFQTTDGNLRATQRRGDRVLIRFADSVTTYEQEDCRETDRIDRIDSQGNIVYRKECKNRRTLTARTKIEPILVPAEEAARLAPGDLVKAVVSRDGRRGSIVEAQRAGMLVQVRGHRLPVKEAVLQ